MSVLIRIRVLTFAATFGAGVTTGTTWTLATVEDVDAVAAVGLALLPEGAAVGALVGAGAAVLVVAVAGDVGELQAATSTALDTATRPARQRRRLTDGANKERVLFPSVRMRPFIPFTTIVDKRNPTGRVRGTKHRVRRCILKMAHRFVNLTN